MKRKILAFVMAVTLSLSAVEVIPQLNDTIVVEAATVKLDYKNFVLRPGWYIENKLKGAKASKVTWKSSNKKVATVNKKGKITGVKKGKATIIATYKKKSYKCTIKIVDDIGRDDFLSQTKDGDKFSLVDMNESSEWIEELWEGCVYDDGKFYYDVLNWTDEAGAYYMAPYLRGIDIGSTYKAVTNAYGDCFSIEYVKDGDVFSGYYANAKHTPVYYVNANYTDGKFQFNRCFYFDENNKVVFILTWFAYEYNS